MRHRGCLDSGCKTFDQSLLNVGNFVVQPLGPMVQVDIVDAIHCYCLPGGVGCIGRKGTGRRGFQCKGCGWAPLQTQTLPVQAGRAWGFAHLAALLGTRSCAAAL